MRHKGIKVQIVIVAILGFVAFWVYLRARRQERVFQERNATIVRLAEPVCQVIAPHTGILSLDRSADAKPTDAPWTVECGTVLDGRSHVTAILQVNPQTNRLENVGIMPYGEGFVRSPIQLANMTLKEGETELNALARRWLIRLNLGEGEEWKALSATRGASLHITDWQTSRQKARVTLDVSDGKLRYLTLKPR